MEKMDGAPSDETRRQGAAAHASYRDADVQPGGACGGGDVPHASRRPADDVPSEERALMEGIREAVVTRMPFGKYGPAAFPPYGLPLCDLPYEYLTWFERKGGFPAGRLGDLMRLVMQIKRDGAEGVFDQLRAPGPRPSLRRSRRLSVRFDDPE